MRGALFINFSIANDMIETYNKKMVNMSIKEEDF